MSSRESGLPLLLELRRRFDLSCLSGCYSIPQSVGVSSCSDRRQVLRSSYCGVRRRFESTAEAKKSLECRHRLSPTIKPEDELVEINLQMTTAHAMMGANDPLLEIADSAIDQRNDGRCTLAELGPQRLSTRHVLKPDLLQASEASQPVRVYCGARSHIP